MMLDAHDPRGLIVAASMEHEEAAYRGWCRSQRLDPEDTQSMIAYERECLRFCNDERAAEEWMDILGE